MTNEKIIFTNWVAYELRKKGFKIIRTEINPNHPNLDCYVFKDTKELHIALGEITAKGKR